jgi:hypothetical protein
MVTQRLWFNSFPYRMENYLVLRSEIQSAINPIAFNGAQLFILKLVHQVSFKIRAFEAQFQIKVSHNLSAIII